MDSTLIWGVVYGAVSILVDGLVWGIAGYVIFRTLGGTRSRWLLGAVATGGLYFVWDEIVLKALMSAIQFQVGHAGMKDLLGSDWLSINTFDAVTSFGSVFFGFLLGRKLQHRIEKGSSQSEHAI